MTKWVFALGSLGTEGKGTVVGSVKNWDDLVALHERFNCFSTIYLVRNSITFTDVGLMSSSTHRRLGGLGILSLSVSHKMRSGEGT